ncbi:MAG: hypothetical protein WCL27_07605 [Betaproteobacteria bacterium]
MPNDTLPPLNVNHTRRFTRQMREAFAAKLPELYSARMDGASFAELAACYIYGKEEAMTPGDFEVLYVEALYARSEKGAASIVEKGSEIVKKIQGLGSLGSDISVLSIDALTSALSEFGEKPASRALADHLIDVSRGDVWYCKIDTYPHLILRKYKDKTRRHELVAITAEFGILVICEIDSFGKYIHKNPLPTSKVKLSSKESWDEIKASLAAATQVLEITRLNPRNSGQPYDKIQVPEPTPKKAHLTLTGMPNVGEDSDFARAQ